MIRIDASLEDGGGHAVRTALTLAALTRREVEVHSIRKNRRLPGLRVEDLPAIRAINQVTHGRLEGDTVGSQTVQFRPGLAQAGSYSFSTVDPVAGSGRACLLLQAIAPILMSASGKSDVVIKGATHGPFAPTATYLSTVFVPTVRKFGGRMDLSIPKWGWGPAGVGELRAQFDSVTAYHGVDLTERGGLLQIGGAAITSDSDATKTERQRNRIVRRCSEVGKTATMQIKHVASDGEGGMIILLAVFERGIAGFTAFDDPDKNAEQVADAVVNEMFDYLTAFSVLDRHMADQVLVYAGLAEGETVFSTSENTAHLRATAAILEQLLPVKVRIDGEAGKPADVTVYGSSGARPNTVPEFFFG